MAASHKSAGRDRMWACHVTDTGYVGKELAGQRARRQIEAGKFINPDFGQKL
jgi:hypothetical protein